MTTSFRATPRSRRAASPGCACGAPRALASSTSKRPASAARRDRREEAHAAEAIPSTGAGSSARRRAAARTVPSPPRTTTRRGAAPEVPTRSGRGHQAQVTSVPRPPGRQPWPPPRPRRGSGRRPRGPGLAAPSRGTVQAPAVRPRPTPASLTRLPERMPRTWRSIPARSSPHWAAAPRRGHVVDSVPDPHDPHPGEAPALGLTRGRLQDGRAKAPRAGGPPESPRSRSGAGGAPAVPRPGASRSGRPRPRRSVRPRRGRRRPPGGPTR